MNERLKRIYYLIEKELNNAPGEELLSKEQNEMYAEMQNLKEILEELEKATVNDGELKIIHMGSGSGSMLSCVLTDNAVDFLRLLAIGYDEICWDEEYPYPPNEAPGNDFYVNPNMEFQKWVMETFGVEIPKTALEIVKYPACMDDESSEDEFFNWIAKFE